MLQNQVFELTFHAPAPETNFAQPELSAAFVHEDSITTLQGFYDGEDTYKV